MLTCAQVGKIPEKNIDVKDKVSNDLITESKRVKVKMNKFMTFRKKNAFPYVCQVLRKSVVKERPPPQDYMTSLKMTSSKVAPNTTIYRACLTKRNGDI